MGGAARPACPLSGQPTATFVRQRTQCGDALSVYFIVSGAPDRSHGSLSAAAIRRCTATVRQMTDDGGNDKALSAALLRALETALHNTEANADRTAGAAAGASRRAQAGDAVLLALSAWLQSDAAHADDMRGDRSARRDQLRGALDALLSSNSSATQPGQRTREPEPAPAVRQSHATEAPDADYIPPAGVSPQLAQKLAAKLAAVAAAREAPEHGSTPTFNDATDPPTESQAVRPPPPAASSAHEVPSTRPTVVGDRYELITRVHQRVDRGDQADCRTACRCAR